MDDARLLALRRDPPPAFSAELRSRLRQQEPMAPGRTAWPIGRIAASIALVGAVVGLFTLPAVRASAQSFLAMFRVVNFVAVPVDEGRVNAFKELDLEHLVGEQVLTLQDPGRPLAMDSVEAAGAAAGIDVREPEWLPFQSRIVEISVSGEGLAQVTADAVRLQQLMDALGIDDLPVPEGLQGQTVAVRVPPIVMVRYEHGGRHTRLFQAHAPEVGLPAGVSPEALGEIGLRILGLSREDAHHFARVIDWNTTLLVPVPPGAQSFKQVDVAGHPGIAIQHSPPNQARTNIVLWSDDDRVFGLVSIQEMTQVMQMANSIR